MTIYKAVLAQQHAQEPVSGSSVGNGKRGNPGKVYISVIYDAWWGKELCGQRGKVQ